MFQTGSWLESIVQGYFNDHTVPGNLDSLGTFWKRVRRRWWRALFRRSQKHRLTWARMLVLADRWLPHRGCSIPTPQYAWPPVTEIRTGCATMSTRPICAGEVSRNWYPYGDLEMLKGISGLSSYHARFLLASTDVSKSSRISLVGLNPSRSYKARPSSLACSATQQNSFSRHHAIILFISALATP